MPEPEDIDMSSFMYQSFNKNVSKASLLKSTTNFKKNLQMPSMDLTKLKNGKPMTRRHVVAIPTTSRKQLPLDTRNLLFLNDSFTNMHVS